MHRHGDVVAMVDSEGETVNTYEYDTYGNITSETEGTSNPFKYAGEHQTLPNSLIYLRNRIYSPALGRFLQEDPIRDGTNWYVYCNSNPVNFIDPMGLSDVVLKYIVEKNGGNITSTDKMVTVTINGKTQEYKIGKKDNQVSIVNGAYIIDNKNLKKDFNLGTLEAAHEVGDGFNTVGDTLLAWGYTYNGSSIASGVEFGSSIYKENGKYKYTMPNVGDDISVDIPPAPKDTVRIAVVHSHGALSSTSESFSENIDKYGNKSGDKVIASRIKLPVYLVTPRGYLKKYDYRTDKTIVINKEMPKKK